MESPTDLPTPAQEIRIQHGPSPLWVRFLAAAADCIVAGLLSFAIILVILIPGYYPETAAIFYDYAQASGGSKTDSDLAKTLLENEALRDMLFSSQIILYSVFFFYYLFNEWMMSGSSLGKKIFRITTIRRKNNQPIPISTIFLRAWLKTVFLLLHPILWITFVWAFFEKDRRTVHDLLTGTWVTD